MDGFPILKILNLLDQEENFVFLETSKSDRQNFLSYIFLRPKQVISTFAVSQVKDCLQRLDQALKAGYYSAGYICYEAGEAFEQRLEHRASYDFPLLWFGVYKQPLVYNHREQNFQRPASWLKPFIKKAKFDPVNQKENYLVKNIRPNITQASYLKAIAQVKDLITQGFTYQVNYTFKLKFSFHGSATGLYLNLRNSQSVPYSALLKHDRKYILSFSPELFFKKTDRQILARPMKGTVKRGRDSAEDKSNTSQLQNCLKNRSENLMIVDLLRNDLGRISTTASVHTRRLFNVEKYQTLFQMTSDIQSKVVPGCLASQIFTQMFPSGSVTGAPKVKTMQIIKTLEKEPRNIYTGSIGFFSPDRSGVFNVAIRTIAIDQQNQAGEMGVGSGIVYDSDAHSEYAECRLKADFLTKPRPEFALIETIGFKPEQGYQFSKLHLARLKSSAGYFDFLYNQQYILQALTKLKASFQQRAYRVRLLLFRDGKLKLEASLLEAQKSNLPRVYFSSKHSQSQDPFLYHKTTQRRIYDQEYRRCQRRGFHDVIFTNEKGEVTEGAISNIFIRKNGRLYTPALNCGLLPGVYRQYLLASKKYPVVEKVLFPKDIIQADQLYLCNSLRGLVKVRL